MCIQRPRARGSNARRSNKASIEDSHSEYGSRLDHAITLTTASLKGLVQSVWYLFTFSSIGSWLRRKDGRKAIFEAIQGGNEMAHPIVKASPGEVFQTWSFLDSLREFHVGSILRGCLRVGEHHQTASSTRRRYELAQRQVSNSALFRCRKGHEDIIRILIDQGAQLDPSPDGAKSPLCYASEAGYESIVRLLIERGTNVNSQDEEQRSPLLYAILGNHVHIAVELIECGASPHSSDIQGRSPLSQVSRRGHYDLAELLISNIAEIDNEDCPHKTPLAYAATELEFETIQVLLKHGADIEAVDGESAMSLALDETHPDIVRAFSNHGAVRPKAECHIVRESLQGDVMDNEKDTEETKDAVQVVPRHRKKLKLKLKPNRTHRCPRSKA
ncbi:unnamed protein product, partial [Clonostachys solani]